jgi:Kazal-type serine protease inhibitor domain
MRGSWSWLALLLFPAVACGGSIAPVETPGNTNQDGGSLDAASVPVGSACGPAARCGASGYCDVGATCGTTGTCAVLPTTCTDIGEPACGCDGITYGNPCTAAAAGVSIAKLGACSTPPPHPTPTGQLFACGKVLCDAATQYCQRAYSDVPPFAETDTCPALPSSCAHTASCTCFPAGTPCVSPTTCQQIATAQGPNYGFEITCPGG